MCTGLVDLCSCSSIIGLKNSTGFFYSFYVGSKQFRLSHNSDCTESFVWPHRVLTHLSFNQRIWILFNISFFLLFCCFCVIVFFFLQMSQLFRKTVWHIHLQMWKRLNKRHSEKMHLRMAFVVSLEPNTATSALAWNPNRVNASQGFQPAGGTGLNNLTKGIPFPQQQLLLLVLSPFCLKTHSFALVLHTNNWRVGIIQKAYVRHPICSFLTAIFNVRL